jgi:hypothetical protein
MSAREYRSADKGQSWKLQLAIAIDEAMKFAVSKEHFISLMENEGYEVKWTDTRKSITYTTPNGMRCRDNKLHEEKYLKEVMENEFYNRKKIYGRFEKSSKNEYAESRERGGVRFSDGQQLESTATGKSESVGNDGFTSKEDRKPIDRPKAVRISESDVGNMQEYQCRNQRNSDKLSARIDENNGEMFREFETDSQGYIITGWETEREIFQQLINVERETPQNNDMAYEDSVSANNSSNSLVSDSAYLFGSLTNIIDDSSVEDCTTMKQQKKERKNTHGGFTMSM